MVLRLKNNDFLRLRGARGVEIEIVDGRVWITEDGRAADSFVGAGGRYLVGGDGMVLIGAEKDETALRISSALLQRVVLAEPRLAETRPGGLLAEADRRREVASL